MKYRKLAVTICENVCETSLNMYKMNVKYVFNERHFVYRYYYSVKQSFTIMKETFYNVSHLSNNRQIFISKTLSHSNIHHKVITWEVSLSQHYGERKLNPREHAVINVWNFAVVVVADQLIEEWHAGLGGVGSGSWNQTFTFFFSFFLDGTTQSSPALQYW